MARFYTADPHFGHSNAIVHCSRPWATVEEMNRGLVMNWNSVVKPEDEVIVVGDFSLAVRFAEQFVKELNGRKVLCAGNHDFCHPANRRSRHLANQQKWIAEYLKYGFAEIHQNMRIELPGIGPVNVSHLPYLGGGDHDGREERYAKHRLKNDSRPLICGHVHSTWKTKGRMINVGVDVWDYKPVSEEQVCAIIKELTASW